MSDQIKKVTSVLADPKGKAVLLLLASMLLPKIYSSSKLIHLVSMFIILFVMSDNAKFSAITAVLVFLFYWLIYGAESFVPLYTESALFAPESQYVQDYQRQEEARKCTSGQDCTFSNPYMSVVCEECSSEKMNKCSNQNCNCEDCECGENCNCEKSFSLKSITCDNCRYGDGNSCVCK